MADADAAAGHMDTFNSITVDDAVPGDTGAGVNAQDATLEARGSALSDILIGDFDICFRWLCKGRARRPRRSIPHPIASMISSEMSALV